jgi:hypothetical protein
MGPALQHSVDCAYAFKAVSDRRTEVGGTKSSREPAANPSGSARVRPRLVLFQGGPDGSPARPTGRTFTCHGAKEVRTAMETINV